MAVLIKWRILLAFAAVYIIWGSTYIAILFGLEGFPPFLMSGFRFCLAGLLLYGWCKWKGIKANGKSALTTNTICGILMLFGGTVSVVWAEQWIPSSYAAIIVTSVPFWFILLDRKQWPYYFSNKKILLGLLIGFLGVILLVGFDKSGSTSVDSGRQLIAALVLLAGGIAWASGSLYARNRPTGNNLMIDASIQLIAAGVFCFLVGVSAGELNEFSFNAIPISSWLAIGYLITLGSIVAYLSYLYLLKVRPAAQVATYAYVNPVVALFLGAVFAGEQVTYFKILALIVIIAGVLLVNIQKYKKQSGNTKNDNDEKPGTTYKILSRKFFHHNRA